MDKGILELEKKIGLEEGFFENLLKEDDWSFIIKLHALFESVCTQLLLFHFNEPGMVDVISRLELSNKSTGRLAFLKSAELLGQDDRKYISSLSEIRNKLVHDVRNTKYSLVELVESLSPKQLTQFVRTFNPFEARIIDIQHGKGIFTKEKGTLDLPRNYDINMLIKRAKENPKEYIWHGAYGVLVSIVDMHGYSDYKQWGKAKRIVFEDNDEE